MKGSSSSLVASIMAASSAMVYSASGDWDVSAYPSSNKGCSSPSKDESSGKSSSSSLEKDQFAPRFDEEEATKSLLCSILHTFFLLRIPLYYLVCPSIEIDEISKVFLWFGTGVGSSILILVLPTVFLQ